MKTNIQELRNIGPMSEKAFIKAGITSKEEILKLGPQGAYEHLLKNGYKPNKNMLYALIGACEDRSWFGVVSAIKQAKSRW